MNVARRRGRRYKKILDDLKDRRGYSHLKEEALDRTMWGNRFGGGFRPVDRQNTEWMNELLQGIAVTTAKWFNCWSPCLPEQPSGLHVNQTDLLCILTFCFPNIIFNITFTSMPKSSTKILTFFQNAASVTAILRLRITCVIRGSHSFVDGDQILLRYDTTLTGNYLQTIRISMPPPSSEKYKSILRMARASQAIGLPNDLSYWLPKPVT